jgi:hypothetical protein
MLSYKALKWYVAAGFSYEDHNRRLMVATTLYFGPFDDIVPAKSFWTHLVALVADQSTHPVAIPRLHRSYKGSLYVERGKDVVVATLRNRHAIAQLSEESIRRLREDFSITPIVCDGDIDIDQLVRYILERARSLHDNEDKE